MKEQDNVMNRVKEWMVGEGIYEDIVQDEDNSTYHFIAEYPANSGSLIDILQPKIREDLIIIASGVHLSDKDQQSLMALRKEKREELLWDVRFNMVFLKTGFEIYPNVQMPQTFRFERSLYFDGLTKNSFMEALNEVNRCKIFISWKLVKLLGDQVKMQEEPMFR